MQTQKFAITHYYIVVVRFTPIAKSPFSSLAGIVVSKTEINVSGF
jgi:hypothetical protein